MESTQGSRRRSVGDRQKTAQRLLFAAAETGYDGELDINWDAPLEPGKDWLPPRLVSIYGTRLWRSMTAQQQTELGKHELVNILTLGVYAECALSMLMFRDIAEADGLADDSSRFGLAAINEETRNATMFGRLINKADLPPYKRPRAVGLLSRLVMFAPTGPAGRATILLIEETMHRLVLELAADPEIQPHVRQLMKIHALSGDRHIEFSRDEVQRTIAERGPVANAVHSLAAAAVTASIYPLLINPEAYSAVGINPVRGVLAAYASDQYARQARAATNSFVLFGSRVGLFGGVSGEMAKAVLRLGRVWPPEQREKIGA
jgi:hypothetical protein